MNVLIRHPFDELIRFKAEDRPGRETLRPVPRGLGQGRFSTIDLRPGMELCLSRCRFTREYRARVTWPVPMLTFVFCMAGGTRTRPSSLSSPIEMTAGKVYLFYFEDPVLDRYARGEMQTVVVRLSPEALSALLSPATEDSGILPRAMAAGRLLWSRPMSASIREVLLKMFACPHRGLVRPIFLESMAMELVAYTLEQFLEIRSCPAILEAEKARILKARDILVQRLAFPPSLPGLARTVGVSHARLTRGFKKVFGCTVFEYLRRERLDYGRRLLSENRLTVTQIAFEAGFCSSSHFASAFQKRFGRSPSAFRIRSGHPEDTVQLDMFQQ